MYYFLEGLQLLVRQHDNERLQEHNGLAQAGVEVIVSVVQSPPINRRNGGTARGKSGSNLSKVFSDAEDHLFERIDFMKKLRTLGEQHAAQEVTHARSTLLSPSSKIGGLERYRVWNNAKVPGMLAQDAQ